MTEPEDVTAPEPIAGDQRPPGDVPSAEVLDELLRAFSVDVTDRARLEQVDLESSEVDDLLAGNPQPSPEGERSPDPGPAVEDVPAAPVEPVEPPQAPAPLEGDRTPGTTILISAEHDPPDAVYLAAGDPLLAPSRTVPPPTVTGGGQRVFIDDASSPEGAVITMEAASSAAHIEPRLRERRIAVKRAASRKRLKWVVLVLLVVGLVVAGLAVLGSGLFAIEEVEVEGAVYTDPTVLAAVVEELEGTPVLRADTDAAERMLEAVPWVADARVTTRFPDGARIELRERTPVATYQGTDGAFRVIDQDGRILDVLDAQPLDYLLVVSPEAPPLAPGEYAPAGFRAAATLVDALTPAMRAVTASVSVTPDAADLRLLLTDGVEVRFGAGTDLVAKLVRLQTWLDVGRGPAVSSVDVSTDEVTTTP